MLDWPLQTQTSPTRTLFRTILFLPSTVRLAGTALAFVDAPPALAKLADLYGVDGILET